MFLQDATLNISDVAFIEMAEMSGDVEIDESLFDADDSTLFDDDEDNYTSTTA